MRQKEVLANKGILWAYYRGNYHGTLVFNTHLTTRSTVQMLQVDEIKSHFCDLCKNFAKESEYFEFYLAGDLNASCDEEELIHLQVH